MRADARAELALLTYQRAVASERARSTRAGWARLLAAARNLRAAIRDLERVRAPRPLGAPAGFGAARAAPADHPEVTGGAGARASTPGERRRPPPQGEAAPPRGGRFPEVSAEIERARALVAWSERLVAEARALCADVAALRARAGA